MLPPSAGFGYTGMPASTMLPPGAENLLPPGGAMGTGEVSRVPLPMPESSPGTISIPGSGGPPVKVRTGEVVKTIRHKGQIVELKQFTPEEKAQRKLVRNIIMMAACLLLLTLVMAIFVWGNKH